VLQYRQKLSGPLLDRIDIRLVVPRLSKRELLGEAAGEPSSAIRVRVEAARARQRRRFVGLGIPSNAQLPGPMARRFAGMSRGAHDVLASAVDSLGLTGRGFDRAIKVARTIADLDGSERVEERHVSEALSYRADVREGELADAG
jgi:magnesium chelatase family protein